MSKVLYYGIFGKGLHYHDKMLVSVGKKLVLTKNNKKHNAQKAKMSRFVYISVSLNSKKLIKVGFVGQTINKYQLLSIVGCVYLAKTLAFLGIS